MKGWLLVVLAALVAIGCSSEPKRKVEPHKAAEINAQLGVQYMNQGSYDIALAKFKKALKQNPDSVAAHNGIAILYETLGETRLAEKHYRKAVSLGPKDSFALNNYGQYLCRTGRWKDAERYFKKATRDPLYKTPEVALTNAGICAWQAGEQDKAEQYLRAALEANPLDPRALFQMAKLSFSQGNYLRTRAYLQRYEQVASHTPESLWLGIETEKRLGDSSAVASYSMLLQDRFPESPQARGLRAGAVDERTGGN